MTGRLHLLSFAAALVMAWFCYSAAFGSNFQLDDLPNLGGLSSVSDTRSAIDFVLSGTSGPTGRPLALLSFVPQADAWPESTVPFLRVNIFIHLINAVLLLLCVRQLFRLRGASAAQATIIASVASAVWVLLPLIATATLLIVQRMTTLSATFLLLGLAGYLWSRSVVERSPRVGLALMSVSLVLGTALATLAKEAGALLPVFVLVVELTLLSAPAAVSRRVWSAWAGVFLGLPLLAALAYLASVWQYPDHVILQRGFDAGERLLTEAQLLWVYLAKALVGLPGRLGVFQGDVEVVRSIWSPAAFAAVASWIVALAVALLMRRRVPLLAFAVLWYLVGHLVESTVVSLELYFEHRNYLPIIGPIVALVAFLAQLAERAKMRAFAVLAVIVLANAWSLYSFASLQSEPSVAARFWTVKYPDSPRAVANLVAYQMEEEGLAKAAGTLGDFVDRNPRYSYFAILELHLNCLAAPQGVEATDVEEVRAKLPMAELTFTANDMLLQLFESLGTMKCNAVDIGTVIELAEALRANPRYAGNPRYNQIHHMLMAKMKRRLGDVEAALGHLDRAFEFGRSVNLLQMKTILLAEERMIAAAREFLEEASVSAPRNPVKALRWRRTIGSLYDYVDAMEQAQAGQS